VVVGLELATGYERYGSIGGFVGLMRLIAVDMG